jgi:hypothetical protein
MWSRVISITDDADEDIGIYSIVKDIEILASQHR